MRKVMRNAFLLLGGLYLVGNLKAHNVVWWENPSGYAASNPMVFYYPNEFADRFIVAPLLNEACTVVVNLSASSYTLVSAAVVTPNPGNRVDIRVLILRAPSNHLETATISGEWHATSYPTPEFCTATNPNPFTVPITVSDQPPKWGAYATANAQMININTGYNCALQYSDCLTGPWVNVGIGQAFLINNNMRMTGGFFQRSTQVGGFISGSVSDSWGNPLTGIGFGLPYGGPSVISDGGMYQFTRMPLGVNVITLSNPVVNASLSVEVDNTNNVVEDWVTDMEGETNADTNVCNCTPWCAIGFGTGSLGQTPVYYSGGANSPKGVPATCDMPTVTITPPSGKPYAITPGTRRRQSSGPDPASGDWTVTVTVCGQSKSATVTVP